MSCIWIHTLLDQVSTIPLRQQLTCSTSWGQITCHLKLSFPLKSDQLKTGYK
jgi:hypothetical protein